LLALCLSQAQAAPPATAPPRAASSVEELLEPSSTYESPMSEDATLAVSGIVEAFMHRLKLMPGEEKCLEKNVGRLAGDVMGAGEQVVDNVKDIAAHNADVANMGLEAGSRLMAIMTVVQELMASCVKGDAFTALKQIAHHLGNVTYIKRHLVVNGVDIAHFLADSVVAFEDKRFHRFGEDIGGAFRQVLLSKASGHDVLPEGMPEDEVIQRASEGLMRGFFVRGADIRITDSYAKTPVDIDIDLHKCITGNSDFFKMFWESSWHLIARMAANKTQHRDSGKGLYAAKLPGNPAQLPPMTAWLSELGTSIVGIPVVLQRCGLGLKQAKMLWDAVKSIKHMHARADWPEENVKAKDITESMARAVSAWTAWDFEGFGFDLGSLLRETLLMIFPQLYWVDDSGRLRRSLEADVPEGAGEAAATPTARAMLRSALGQQRLTARELLGGVLLVLLAAAFTLHALVTTHQQGGGYALPGCTRRDHRVVELDCSTSAESPAAGVPRLVIAAENTEALPSPCTA